MIATVAVDLDVVGQQLDGFPFEAVNGFIDLVPPVQIQPRPVGRSAGFGVGCDEDFIGQPLHVRVGNLTGPVVRCMRW